jgi:transketolase
VGDLLRDAVEGTLFYAPPQAFERAVRLNAPSAVRIQLFATLARLNALYMIARAGSGHIGSSFSSLDIVSWLHLDVMKDGDRYFSSKGHDVPGLYSVLTGMGKLPFESIHGLRRLGGLPGHPDIDTLGIAANTGSLGMGISKAKGMVRTMRYKGEIKRVFVLTGDGELQEGQIWESLAGAVRERMSEITVIVDHNKLQSDTFVERVSPLGDLEAKFAAFGWAVARTDGHEIDALAASLARLDRATGQPRVLIADTIKGKGVSFMSHTALAPGEEFYKFHSGAPSTADYRRAAQELVDTADALFSAHGSAPLTPERLQAPAAVTPPGRAQRMVPAYTDALIAAAARKPELIALDADLILDTGLIPFRERFPGRFVECGIAEQDMVSQASGMALGGLLPIVHSFACFLTARPNEQIYNAASERGHIVYVGTLSGLVPAGPGHSHQGIRDIASLSSIPGMTLVEPCHMAEVQPLLDWCVDEAKGPCYLRLVSVPCDVPYSLPRDYRVRYGRGVTLREGRDAVLIGYGPLLLSEAYRCAEQLEQGGLSLKIVNLPWLNAIDSAWLAETVGNAQHVITLDNHVAIGGQGQLVAATLARLGLDGKRRVQQIALEGWPACGTPAEVLAHHGLDAAGLTRTIKSFGH